MSDMAFRPAPAGEANLGSGLIRGDSKDAIAAELASERKEREFLEAKLDRQRTLVENLKRETDTIPLLRRRIGELEEAQSSMQERLAEANLQLAARYSELAGITRSLLAEEEAHEEQRRETQKLLKIVRAILVEVHGAPALLSRRRLTKRLSARLAHEGLFDSRVYSAQFPDVVAAGHDPVRHYFLHGIEEIGAGCR